MIVYECSVCEREFVRAPKTLWRIVSAKGEDHGVGYCTKKCAEYDMVGPAFRGAHVEKYAYGSEDAT